VTDPTAAALGRAVAPHYAIERPLGPHAGAASYLARDLRLARPVVVSLLAGTGPRDRRLLRATEAARLAHPNIVPVHAVGADDSVAWFVSSFVQGESVAARIGAARPLPPTEGARLARELAWALAYAHEEGVVHGALDPAQVYLEDETGRALITGFGALPLKEEVDAATDLRSLVDIVVAALLGRAPLSATETRSAVSTMPEWAAKPLLAILTSGPGEPTLGAQALAESLTPPARAELPLPLRRWLEAPNPLTVILLSSSALQTILWTINSGGTLDTYLLDTWAPWILVWPAAILQLRRVLRAGYTRGDVLGVLDQQLRIRREEMGDRPPRPGGRRLALVLLVGLCMAGALMIDPLQLRTRPIVQFLVLVVAFLVVGVGVREWRDRGGGARPRDEILEFKVAAWRGFLGRWTFRLAGLGLRGPKQATSAFDQRPTTMVLADAVSALAEQLPAGLRRQFPDLAVTVGRLEAAATALRRRVDRLEGIEGPEAGAALRNARERHADAVVALETLRLTLLAALGGVAEIGGVTRDLEEALGVAAQIEALAAGHGEAGAVELR
jgi:hypothetical protein